jgi:hypothetical protein
MKDVHKPSDFGSYSTFVNFGSVVLFAVHLPLCSISYPFIVTHLCVYRAVSMSLHLSFLRIFMANFFTRLSSTFISHVFSFLAHHSPPVPETIPQSRYFSPVNNPPFLFSCCLPPQARELHWKAPTALEPELPRWHRAPRDYTYLRS